MDVQDQARQVIEHVAEGKTLREAVAAVGMRVSVFHRAISGVRELQVDYARVREIRADVDVDDALAIADNPDIDPNRARNMIDIRKWRATKYNPKTFGDRIDLNIQSSISILDTRSEAMARVLRPMRDPEPTLDVDVIDTHTLSTSGASDSVSDDARGQAAEPPIPDIFS